MIVDTETGEVIELDHSPVPARRVVVHRRSLLEHFDEKTLLYLVLGGIAFLLLTS